MGANPESSFNAVANTELGHAPLSKVWITFVDLLSIRQLERGVAPNLA